MKLTLPLAASLLLLLSLWSCDRRPEALSAKVASISSGLSAQLAEIKDSEVAFIQGADQVYTHLDQYDLATNKMDVKSGGMFETFPGNKYYYKTVQEGVSYYASPLKPVDERLRKEIRTMQHVEGFLTSAYERNQKFVTLAFFGIHEPSSIAMLYPWTDVLSFLPPGLDFHVLEWYTRGLESPGEPRWSKNPFVSLYGGWVVDVSAPLIVNAKTKGVVVMTVVLEKVNSEYFKNEQDNLLLLGSDLTLVVANAPARKALPLKVIEDVDYVKQMKENSFASATYQLSDPGQPEGLRAVAAQIQAGKKQFEQVIDGTPWQFYVGDVQQVGFYTVGFFKK